MPTKTCPTFRISVLAHAVSCSNLLCTDMPSLHRRSNHQRWVLTGDLTKVEDIAVWILIAPTEPKQPTLEKESHPDSHWLFLKQTRTITQSTERDVQPNSHSLTYSLGWGQQLETQRLRRTPWAVSLGLNFSDTQYTAQQPNLTDCSHTRHTQRAIYSKRKISTSTGRNKIGRLCVYPMVIIQKHQEELHYLSTRMGTEKDKSNVEFWPLSICQRKESTRLSKNIKAEWTLHYGSYATDTVHFYSKCNYFAIKRYVSLSVFKNPVGSKNPP